MQEESESKALVRVEQPTVVDLDANRPARWGISASSKRSSI